VSDNTTKANSSSSPANELQCQMLNEKVVNCSSQVSQDKLLLFFYISPNFSQLAIFARVSQDRPSFASLLV
jgi:hypothetical protein